MYMCIYIYIYVCMYIYIYIPHLIGSQGATNRVSQASDQYQQWLKSSIRMVIHHGDHHNQYQQPSSITTVILFTMISIILSQVSLSNDHSL